jgi:hypothetical protein
VLSCRVIAEIAVRLLQWIGRLGVIVLLGAPVAAQAQSQSPSPSAPAEPPASSAPPPLPDLPGGRRGEIIKPGIPAPSDSRGRALPDPRCGALLESQRRVTPGCQ